MRFATTSLLIALIFVFSCKKYPENNLWFKNPKKLIPFNGRLIKYTVNGIDSLDLLNNYFGNAYGLPKDIRKAEFITDNAFHSNQSTVLNFGSSGLEVPVGDQFVKNKKYIKIYCLVDTSLFKKNLFISFDTEWQIIRLAKTGPFKIKTTLDNGNTYEIEIN